MRRFTHDLYAPLNFRSALGDGIERPPDVPEWIPDDEARRVAAYALLRAYLDGCSRYYLPDALWQKPASVLTEPLTGQVEIGKSAAEKYREYGDARLLIEQGIALVLGESQELVIPDAQPLPDDAPDADRAAQTAAVVFDEWLQDWADTERLWLRLHECEEDAQALGDGVLVLGWDAEAARPRLRKYDAESYFPVLSGDQDADEFPNRVHFAWCELLPNRDELLHRLTYDRRRLPDGATRRYAYAPDVDSPWAVYQTHATWVLSKVRGSTSLLDLSESSATFLTTPDGTQIRNLDIGVDFVPVVHVPNTPGGGRHFGRSLLLPVAQLLDDLGFADSDLAVSSEVVGNTPLVLTGGAGGQALDRGPGSQWNLPAGGDARLLDTSGVLTGQIGYVGHLLDRLSVNTRLPAALLGRVKPNEVPSGFAMSLGFASARALVSKLRLVRAEKHPLIPKFAMRFAQVNGKLPEGETPRAEIELGPYLPEDVAAAIDRVKTLLGTAGGRPAISTHTAVQILVNAGLPIDDATAEVEKIHAESFAAAVQLLEATGDETAVRKFLGLDSAAAPPTPTPPTPPNPPNPVPAP